jgi:hypothetical protein
MPRKEPSSLHPYVCDLQPSSKGTLLFCLSYLKDGKEDEEGGEVLLWKYVKGHWESHKCPNLNQTPIAHPCPFSLYYHLLFTFLHFYTAASLTFSPFSSERKSSRLSSPSRKAPKNAVNSSDSEKEVPSTPRPRRTRTSKTPDSWEERNVELSEHSSNSKEARRKSRQTTPSTDRKTPRSKPISDSSDSEDSVSLLSRSNFCKTKYCNLIANIQNMDVSSPVEASSLPSAVATPMPHSTTTPVASEMVALTAPHSTTTTTSLYVILYFNTLLAYLLPPRRPPLLLPLTLLVTLIQPRLLWALHR